MTPAATRTADLLILVPIETAAGFRLAGARTTVATDPGDVQRIVAAEIAAGSRGVIAIAATSWAALPAPVRRAWAASTVPLIVPLPAEDGESAQVRGVRIRDLLARSVGYEITFTPEGNPS